MSTTHLRSRRPGARLITTALAASALLAPAALTTQAASAKAAGGGTTTTTGCKAGATKKVNGTVVAVCNTQGKWVKTVNLDGDAGSGTVDQGPAGADASGAVAPDTAAQREDRAEGSGSAPVGCALADGTTVPPGETIAIVSITKDSHGNVIKHTVDNWICGDDGQFHLVARLASPANYTRVTTVAATDRPGS